MLDAIERLLGAAFALEEEENSCFKTVGTSCEMFGIIPKISFVSEKGFAGGSILSRKYNIFTI